MRYIAPTRLRREARAKAAALAVQARTQAVAAATAEHYRTTLQSVLSVTDGVKTPNGTTKKIGRIVAAGLSGLTAN